jgi:hypothetical protein
VTAAPKLSPARERPILFSGPMIRKILANEKWQTRRIIKRLRVVPRHDVTSLIFAEELPGVPLSVDARWTYDVDLNPHGAVSAQLGAGKTRAAQAGGVRLPVPLRRGHTYLRKHQDDARNGTFRRARSTLGEGIVASCSTPLRQEDARVISRSSARIWHEARWLGWLGRGTSGAPPSSCRAGLPG